MTSDTTAVRRKANTDHPIKLGPLEDILGYYLRRAQSTNFQLFDKTCVNEIFLQASLACSAK